MPRHHIKRLSFFGSILNRAFKPESDIDALVELQPGLNIGFIGLYLIEEELSDLVGGRKVDLVTSKFLNPLIRDKVLAEAQVQYID